MRQWILWILALSVWAILIAVLGCGKWIGRSSMDVEEQKLSLEVMHAERQELASLLEAQKKTFAENQQSLQELEHRRAELQSMKQSVEKEQQHLDATLAQANAKLAVADERLSSRVQELKALEAKNQKQLDELAARRREITAALGSIGSGPGSPVKAQGSEPDRQQVAEKKATEQQLARRQYLESLADATIAIVKKDPVSVAYDNPQLARRQLLERLLAAKPAGSESQFQEAANRAAEGFAKQSTKRTLTEAEIAAIHDFAAPPANRQASSAH